MTIKNDNTTLVESIERLGKEGVTYLAQLEQVFKAIKEKHSKYTDTYKLAEAGQYLAMDYSNNIDCGWETLIEDEFKKEGMISEAQRFPEIRPYVDAKAEIRRLRKVLEEITKLQVPKDIVNEMQSSLDKADNAIGGILGIEGEENESRAA